MKRCLSVVAVVVLLTVPAACAGSELVATPTTPDATRTAAAETQPISNVETGVVYAQATSNGAALRLNMAFPADPAGAPIVITDKLDITDELARAGVIAVYLGYSSYQGHPEAEILGEHGIVARENTEEYACALRLARARAAELGSPDPTVVLTGFSAQGGRAALAALFGATLDAAWEEFAATGGPPRQLECEVTDGSTHVDALVGVSGAYDAFVPIYDDKYGRAFLKGRDPELQAFLASVIGANPGLKVRLLHGTADSAIPARVAAKFQAALTDAGYDARVTTFNGGHAQPTDLLLATILDVLGR